MNARNIRSRVAVISVLTYLALIAVALFYAPTRNALQTVSVTAWMLFVGAL